jgi:hypothetical protein
MPTAARLGCRACFFERRPGDPGRLSKPPSRGVRQLSAQIAVEQALLTTVFDEVWCWKWLGGRAGRSYANHRCECTDHPAGDHRGSIAQAAQTPPVRSGRGQRQLDGTTARPGIASGIARRAEAARRRVGSARGAKSVEPVSDPLFLSGPWHRPFGCPRCRSRLMRLTVPYEEIGDLPGERRLLAPVGLPLVDLSRLG